MEDTFTPVRADNCDDFLRRYHGFHDAQYGHIILRPDPRGIGVFECSVLLRAHDHVRDHPADVEFRMIRLREFQFKYDTKYDYPNIRDDIAIAFYGHQAFINFGFATESSVSPDDIRASDVFFVCDELCFRVLDGGNSGEGTERTVYDGPTSQEKKRKKEAF